MPDDYYVLPYSGEEIEELLDKAGSATGAVRYDAAQSLTDEQKQQARENINAAPDGFGYGGALDTVSGATDEAFLAAVESKLATMPDMGAMQINWGSYPALDGLARVGTLAKHTGGQYASLTGYSYGGTAITRCKNAGAWGAWEWVNPPMQLGVEYRTTERYLGKPVYVRLVSCGNAPSNSLKKIDTGLDYTVIDRRLTPTGNMYASSNDNFSIPCESTNVAGENLNIAHGIYRDSGDVYHDAVFIHTTSTSLTGYTVYVVLKYTKTTD